MMYAFAYLGSLPQRALADRMKRVLVQMDGPTPVWNPQWANVLAALGGAPRVCRPYAPQTKGKVERSIRVVKERFWPGVRFTDGDDLNRQVLAWCDRRNQVVPATTRAQERRMRAARLPVMARLARFDFRFQPGVSERLMRELSSLAFVPTATNVVFLGPLGVGKPQPAVCPTREGRFAA